MTWTPRAIGTAKYAAVPTVVDGVRFASKKEARRYAELRLLEQAGQIRELELQPVYVLHVSQAAHPFVRASVGKYVADFRYREGPQGLLVVEDVKGCKTPVYRLKKRMVAAEYGVIVRET